MRILVVTNRLPWPLNDGGNIATYNVIRQLHAQGHTVVLAALNTQKHHQDPQVLAHVAEVHTVDIDTSLRPIPMFLGLFRAMPYNVARFDDPGFHALLARLVQEQEFDLIQLEGSYQAIYLKTLRKHAKVPVVLRSHNVEYLIWKRLAENESSLLKRIYLNNLWKKIKAFEEQTIHQFDGVVAITEEDRDHYQKMGYRGPLKAINAGVDKVQWQPAAARETGPTICFIGSMEWQPNLQGIRWFLAEVWPDLHAKYPEATFHIAGKNPPEDLSMFRLPGVTFHGMVPDAVSFLNRFRIFVVPLQSGGGMRLKVVEAMALEMAVVSTPVGAEGVAYTEGKDILICDSAEAFVETLGLLFEAPERSLRLGEAARLTALSKYDWEVLVAEFVAFYEELTA